VNAQWAGGVEAWDGSPSLHYTFAPVPAIVQIMSMPGRIRSGQRVKGEGAAAWMLSGLV
jgi:hypothetical protein